jgi:hypothetical protein
MTKLGFRTQKEAIAALTEDGLSAGEIADRLNTTVQSVWARQSEFRKLKAKEALSPERLAWAKRIHEAALGVIAEAMSISVAQLKTALAQPDLASTVIEIDSVATAPVMATPAVVKKAKVALPVVTARPPAATGQRLYRFVEPYGQWLCKDGCGFTSEPGQAWSGTSEQAKSARPTLRDARYCKIEGVR